MREEVYICDNLRTPFGRYGGGLSGVRADDLAAQTLRGLLKRNCALDPENIEDVFLGCANQAGEDNRNIARMAALLAGLPVLVPGVTLNRLCGSGMDAVGSAARAIASGEMDLAIAGGVESMSRAPFVMAKAEIGFSRKAEFYDTTMGWRFVNERMRQIYGIESMPETAENLAEEFRISRSDQDMFALRSQRLASSAQKSGILSEEILPVTISQPHGSEIVFSHDEHLRNTSLEILTGLPSPFRRGGTVTAGNASGINDGAAAMLVASRLAVSRNGLEPLARLVTMTTVGVEPRVMGIGPAPAIEKLLKQEGVGKKDISVIEVNEAFAAQTLAVLRRLGIADDDPRVNPNGGAIALGHPLGASGARLVLTAARELQRNGGRYAVCAMCVGVGQGIAVLLERV